MTWIGLAGVLLGCGANVPAPAESSDTSSAADASSEASSDSSGDPVVGSFELGFGDLEFAPLNSGEVIPIVVGGQGAAMFPLALRGSQFVLPDPPSDYTSELAPLFDLDIDIEGYNNGPGNHFKHLANYPITFTVLPDASYEFVYVAVLLPDDIDPAVLEGLPAHLSARLRPADSAAFEVELDLIVGAVISPN